MQSSTTVASVPPLDTIDLRQFSPSVSGSAATPGRVAVSVLLARAGVPVALGQTETRADGSWGPVTLSGPDGRPHAVGDDRDQLEVFYGAGLAAPDYVQTGDGGNPFTEAGFTGWYELDNGYAAHPGAGGLTIELGPCSQTGVLSLRVGAVLTPSPTPACGTETDAAMIRVAHAGTGSPVTLTSEDNRGEYGGRPDGALVKLTVALGEPDSVSASPSSQLSFIPSGFPSCTAFLRIGAVRCSGLVPAGRYRLARRGHTVAQGRAGGAGVVTLAGLDVKGGDVLTLVDGAGRRLTSLHVAHLRVDIAGDQTQIASGTCQPGDYWGPPVTHAPTSGQIGEGISGSGTICPNSGRAKGLPAAEIAQTDEFSGGQTETQVPVIESTAPIQDETLYGSFIASAQSGLPGPHGSVAATGVPVALTIAPAGHRRHVAFHSTNVDTASGVTVPALTPGSYVATWVLHDAAGDTRTVTTRFVDQA